MLSFENRIAIITGAGRGLGQKYAEELAARGAKVVVNDLGVDLDGQGSDPSVAQGVVNAICANGGDAIVDYNDVASEAGAYALVEKAISTYGKVDIVINNAGVLRRKSFDDVTFDDFLFDMRIHLGGHVNVTRAAWPIMKSQRYGRVIVTESAAGLYGLAGQVTYGSAKGAIHGFMRTLAIEGREHGILVNAIQPGAFTRLGPPAISDLARLEKMKQMMPTNLVAAVTVWMASEDCQETGQVFMARAGRVARVVLGRGEGFVDSNLTPELVAANVDRVLSIDGLNFPSSVFDDQSDALD